MPRKPKNPPIVVLDTNVLISYLFGSKLITLLIDSLEKDAFIPAFSPNLETEFLDVVKQPRIARSLNTKLAVEFMADWVNFVLYVKPTIRVTACRDPDDNAVLECALSASADYIVSGDTDLLTLHFFQQIPIITPGYFVRNILKIY